LTSVCDDFPPRTSYYILIGIMGIPRSEQTGLCPFDCPDSWQKDSTFRIVYLYGETARGTPESEGLERGPAQGFLAKYWDLPAAYHEVPKGKACRWV